MPLKSMFVSVAEQIPLFRQGSEVNNFLYDVQDLYLLQKEKKIKKHRKGLGPDYPYPYIDVCTCVCEATAHSHGVL